MNERIKELVRESNLDVYGLGKDRYKWESTIEKFAELILWECTIILMTPENTTKALPKELAEYNRGWVNGRNLGRKRIKEYFGVKE